jgi:hypothetical protein
MEDPVEALISGVGNLPPGVRYVEGRDTQPPHLRLFINMFTISFRWELERGGGFCYSRVFGITGK